MEALRGGALESISQCDPFVAFREPELVAKLRRARGMLDSSVLLTPRKLVIELAKAAQRWEDLESEWLP